MQSPTENNSSDALFSGLVNSAIDLIITISEKGIIQSFNPAAEKFFQYKARKVIGKNIKMLMPRSYSINHDQYLKNYRDTGKAKIIGKGRMVTALKKDGTESPIHLSVTEAVVDGQRIFLGIARDTTALKDAKEALEHSERRANAILSTAVDGIVTISHNGVIQSVNSAVIKLFGYEDSELIGKNVHILVPTPHKEKHNSYLENYIKTGVKKIIGIGREVLAMKKDGAQFPIFLSISEFKVDDEIYFTGIIRDLTEIQKSRNELAESNEVLKEQKRVALELAEKANHVSERLRKKTHKLEKMTVKAEKANELKSQFMTNMSHEMRTPLNAVLGMSELLASTALDSKQDKYVENIHTAGDGLLGIVNDILDFSSIQAGNIKISNEKLDLNLLTKEVQKFLNTSAAEKKLAVESTIASDMPTFIIGDALRIKQILIHLMNNAVKFTQDGHIYFRVESQKSESNKVTLTFQIEDTGVGIEPETLKQIFNSFAQADNASTRKFDGAGLGLAIVKSLANMMDGKISVKSEVGVGSTFTFECQFQINEQGPRVNGKNS